MEKRKQDAAFPTGIHTPYICKQKFDKDVQNGIPASRDYNVPLLAWRTISEEA